MPMSKDRILSFREPNSPDIIQMDFSSHTYHLELICKESKRQERINYEIGFTLINIYHNITIFFDYSTNNLNL